VKTYSAKLKEIQKNWRVIDAKGIVLGRLASSVANILRGKDKPTYTPHMDCGDNVIIINAKHVHLTGKKSDRKDGKMYYWHTGFPGGIKETTAGKILEGKTPEKVMRLAIQRMITRNNLGRTQMSNLYIYQDESHPHDAQKPLVYDFASKNLKNARIK
jgi:large subunit ribosomal protein L13